MKRLTTGAAILLLTAFLMGGQAIALACEYLWFGELGLSEVFWKSILSRWGLGLGGGAAAAAALGANLLLAKRLSRRSVLILEDDERDELPGLRDFRELLRPGLFLIFGVATLVLGSWLAGEWEQVLLWLHRSAFGSADPVFGRDIGYYVFSLPVHKTFLAFLQTTLFFCLALAGVAYVVEGKALVTSRGPRIAEEARNHLLVLIGLLCMLAALQFQLRMYGMLSLERTVAPGPGYADVNAYFHALRALRFVALGVGALLLAVPFGGRLSWGLAGIATLLIGLFGAGVARSLIQRLIVAPNEIVKETPYISAAIEHTRKAFGIDRVEERQFQPVEKLTAESIHRNQATVQNIRLWDHEPLLTTYAQLQEIRTYYDFMDVDNDRYVIDGQYRQVMLSPRELNPGALPSRIWINEHLTYTHGYGLTMGPVNRISREGLPEFFVKDIPPRTEGGIKVTRPEIYFGEARGSYVVVNTRSKEFDYPSGDENIYTQYAGKGGIPLKGLARKLLFALRFGEPKILLSSDLGPESRVLFRRNIRERLHAAMPLLRYDNDPYMVVGADGRLHWIVDAYTVTDRYPFSQRLPGLGNYIRNSVKAVVDAYHGSVAFYVVDEQDPIVRTMRDAFPATFRPISEMPQDLRAHLRYPQDLFSIQAYIYATYHMTDPQVFYNKEDLWKIPQRGQGRRGAMQPYYTIMKLAGLESQEEFLLMVPFTPARKENMIAWLAARCDPPNYGRLLVYNFPKQELVYGPQQIESRIDQDPEISKQLTLWNQGGSKVIRGSLLVIPVESSLLYVQPLYLEAADGGLPELKRVIVAYGNSIAMEEDLEQSLSRIFTGRVERPSGAAAAKAEPRGGDQRQLIRDANAAFERAQSRLRAGDFAGYGDEMGRLGQLLKRLTQ